MFMEALTTTEGEEDDEMITRLRERFGEVIGARGLEALSAAALGVDPAEVSNERAAQATQSTDPEPFTGQGNRLATRTRMSITAQAWHTIGTGTCAPTVAPRARSGAAPSHDLWIRVRRRLHRAQHRLTVVAR